MLNDNETWITPCKYYLNRLTVGDCCSFLTPAGINWIISSSFVNFDHCFDPREQYLVLVGCRSLGYSLHPSCTSHSIHAVVIRESTVLSWNNDVTSVTLLQSLLTPFDLTRSAGFIWCLLSVSKFYRLNHDAMTTLLYWNFHPREIIVSCFWIELLEQFIHSNVYLTFTWIYVWFLFSLTFLPSSSPLHFIYSAVFYFYFLSYHH